MNQLAIIEEVKGWVYEAGEKIKASFDDQLEIDTKSGRTDLVTDMDKATQDFLIEKIMAFDPSAKILGEENGQDHLQDVSGRVFIIDPIDGTMNFVLEQENFCIMLALYEDGVSQLGFVYNVMKDEFLYGGKETGVFCNGKPVTPPMNKSLSEGLVGMNQVMFQRNDWHAQEIGKIAMGVRMTGCAGYELIDLALGRRVAYISRLAPWDYAPGGVLIEALGLTMSTIDGRALGLEEREIFLAGTQKAYDECLEIANS